MTKSKKLGVLFCKTPSLTKQYFKDECDINNVIKRFTETGQIPVQNNLDPQYGDAPDFDLKTALDLVKNAHREFDELSPQNKQLFDNDSQNYLNFLQEYSESPEIFSEPLKSESDILLPETQNKPSKTSVIAPDEVSADK